MEYTIMIEWGVRGESKGARFQPGRSEVSFNSIVEAIEYWERENVKSNPGHWDWVKAAIEIRENGKVTGRVVPV